MRFRTEVEAKADIKVSHKYKSKCGFGLSRNWYYSCHVHENCMHMKKLTSSPVEAMWIITESGNHSSELTKPSHGVNTVIKGRLEELFKAAPMKAMRFISPRMV